MKAKLEGDRLLAKISKTRDLNPAERTWLGMALGLEKTLSDRDSTKLKEAQTLIEANLTSGDPASVRTALGLLHAELGANVAAGRPLSFKLDAEATNKLTNTISQMVGDPHPAGGTNKAEVYATTLGELTRAGIVRLSRPTDEVLSSISTAISRVDRESATRLHAFALGGEQVIDAFVSARWAKLQQETRNTRLDADVGGKKPAAKNGVMLWRP